MTISVYSSENDGSIWRIDVTNDVQSLTLAFDHSPTDAEIMDAATQTYADYEANQLRLENERQIRLTLLDSVQAYTPDWSDADTRALLEALLPIVKAKGLL